jgi:hypothetical protein
MVNKLCLSLALLSLVSSNCLDSCPAHKLGNGECDDECNTYECSFDGSDCLTYCECEVSLLGDGICNQECYYEQCSWDYRDCDHECLATSCDLSQLGDGICNQECNNLACEHDRGDCYHEKSVEENYTVIERSNNLSIIQYRHSSRSLSSTSDNPYIAIYIIIPIMLVIMAAGIALRIYRIRAYRRMMKAQGTTVTGVTVIPPAAPQVMYVGAPNQGIQMQPQPVYGSMPVNGPMVIPNQQYQGVPPPAYGGMPSAGPGAMYNQSPAYPNQAYSNPAYGNMQANQAYSNPGYGNMQANQAYSNPAYGNVQGYEEKPVGDLTIKP